MKVRLELDCLAQGLFSLDCAIIFQKSVSNGQYVWQTYVVQGITFEKLRLKLGMALSTANSP